jgi:phosphoribosyl-AMP cyclohydrolase
MVANMNEEALVKTLTTGLMHYWSRSRKRLWLKGETSGHYQHVRGVWVDCDGDAALFDVEQMGAACHEGYYSCFYRKLRKGKLVIALKRKFNPKKVYGTP